MAGYVVVPIETDPDALALDAFDFMAAKTDGRWQPHDGQLDTWQFQANARMAATLRDTASDVPKSIFRYFGTLVGVPPIDSSAAISTITVQLGDTNGHMITQGEPFGITDAYGNLIDFTVTTDTFVAAGVSSISGVPIAAVDEGAAQSELGAPGAVVTPLGSKAWIASATLDAATSGGTDAEDDDVYLGRLARNLRLMAPRPILPGDFALMSQNVAGVDRALALDGYDAVAATSGNARTITVALVDSSGNPVPTSTLNVVQAMLAGLRESTFLVYVINPSYTTVDVQFDVTAWPGVDKTALNAAIVANIQNFLSPANWGNPAGGDQRFWYNVPNVKVSDLESPARIDGTQVQNVNSVLIRTGINAFATADVVMAGPAPLPLPGAITGTVH